VHISKVNHGPAITMTLVPFQGSPVKHNINVDITLSLECDIPLSRFGWPREKTKQAFERDLINEVLNAGIHLVPKKDLFWAISFSKAERALLSRLDDTDGGCRKYVTKIMKKFVMNCISQSINGLPGISSHVIKVHSLYFNFILCITIIRALNLLA
jgi:predicted phosphohydrolase